MGAPTHTHTQCPTLQNHNPLLILMHTFTPMSWMFTYIHGIYLYTHFYNTCYAHTICAPTCMQCRQNFVILDRSIPIDTRGMPGRYDGFMEISTYFFALMKDLIRFFDFYPVPSVPSKTSQKLLQLSSLVK